MISTFFQHDLRLNRGFKFEASVTKCRRASRIALIAGRRTMLLAVPKLLTRLDGIAVKIFRKGQQTDWLKPFWLR